MANDIASMGSHEAHAAGWEAGYMEACRAVVRAAPDKVNEICEAALGSGEILLERRLSDAQDEQ